MTRPNSLPLLPPLGCAIYIFFWFLFFSFFGFLFFWCFFWFCFCLAIAENPSRNCQWLQSSERTIAHVQCQWLQNAVTPRVSPSEIHRIPLYWHQMSILHSSAWTSQACICSNCLVLSRDKKPMRSDALGKWWQMLQTGLMVLTPRCI